MTGFGTAYDAAVRSALAQARRGDRRQAHRNYRHERYHQQLMSHVMGTDRRLDLLKSIEDQMSHNALKESDRLCPECGEVFVLIETGGVEIDACLSCGGFWLDPGELKSLTHRAADIQTLEGAVEDSKYDCPICQTRMQQHRFLIREDLLIDCCPNGHGYYLERGELIRSIER